ncbi:MAG: hypothetical protein C0507_17145 [Cyanobacteria bacterium PR.3.49]|jgi:subtilisin family serine protease|nr:hypothetical protein [Cyanobacteria bacterium PR.3.49]
MLNAVSFRKFGRIALSFTALMMLSAVPFAPSASAAGGTILVCTQPGGSVETAKQTLRDSGCTILAEIPCEVGRFTILQVRPNGGNVTAAVSQFNGSIDANILSAEETFQTVASHSSRRRCAPDDPEYPSQYALPAMQWNDARCALKLLGVKQRSYPRMTVIDSGINKITRKDEMEEVTQYNFTSGALGVRERPFDSGLHGTSVAAVACALTDNDRFIAGSASHNLPGKIVSCRISNDGATIDTMDVLRAMTWCVDNQRLRGGPGAINLSIQSPILPTYNGSSVVQEIAKAARRQGDLFVNCAGNEALVDPSPEKNLRRVMAFDEDNNVASFSNTGPFKAGAPGVNITTVTGTPPTIYVVSGTSLSSPYWAGTISFLQSFMPWNDAVKLDAIVYGTADKTSQGNRIPNYERALGALLFCGWW